MQVLVSTSLSAVPITHQALLLPLASLWAEITQSKRSTLSALVKASTSLVRRSTSCLKTHYGAWISMRGVFTRTAWVYFRMAVQNKAMWTGMETARPSSRKKLRDRTTCSTHSPKQWLFECAATLLKTLKKTVCICCFYRKELQTV